MACSGRCLRSTPDVNVGVGTEGVRVCKVLTTLAFMSLCFGVHAQDTQVSQEGIAKADVTELESVRVIGRRQQSLYRSKPVERTPPTVFERDWREPINLQKIGMEGGLVPLLVRYASQQATKAARAIPGWKTPVQPAIARPPPLDETQMRRAAELQATP